MSTTNPPAREVLPVELLLTETQRVSVDQHQAWRESLAPKTEADEIDDFLTELRELKPEKL